MVWVLCASEHMMCYIHMTMLINATMDAFHFFCWLQRNSEKDKMQHALKWAAVKKKLYADKGNKEQKIISGSDENLLEWQMQIKVGCVLNNNHSRSCITEACCYLKLETAISWNRNPELPKHLSIMQSSHIPNVLCYRILFFHLWWTPRFKSKQYDMGQLLSSRSPLSYFRHYLSLPTWDRAKRSMALTSAALHICSANLDGGGDFELLCELWSMESCYKLTVQLYSPSFMLCCYSFTLQLTTKYNCSDLEAELCPQRQVCPKVIRLPVRTSALHSEERCSPF